MSVKIKMSSLSAEEYLEGELRSEVKHELVGGQAYARVPAISITWSQAPCLRRSASI